MRNFLELVLDLELKTRKNAEFGKLVRSQLRGFYAKDLLVKKITNIDCMFCPIYSKKFYVSVINTKREWNHETLEHTSYQALQQLLSGTEKDKKIHDDQVKDQKDNKQLKKCVEKPTK